MKLEGTYTFEAPSDVVWEALMAPEVLAKVIPGCKKLEQTGENEYETAMLIKVGPVQGNFQGAVKLADIDAPQSYTMHVEGKGQAGFVKGAGQVWLEDQGQATLMHYGGEAQVGGRIASIGQRLMDSTAKAMTKQGLDGLHRQIKARASAPASTPAGNGAGTAESTSLPPLRAVEAPGQVEFALGVAKNMVEDLLPPERQRLLIGAGVGLVAFIFLLNRWIKSVARGAVAEALRKDS